MTKYVKVDASSIGPGECNLLLQRLYAFAYQLHKKLPLIAN